MIIIITGSRDWRHPAFVGCVLNTRYVKYGPFILYHGDCRDRNGNPIGADAHADRWAQTAHGIDVRPRPADWNRYGNAAGPIRNREMVHEAAWAAGDLNEVRCDAFQRDDSRGTQNTIDICEGLGIHVDVWTEADVQRLMSARK